MKHWAVFCFAMSAVTLVIGGNNIVLKSQSRSLESLISYGVGAMLIPIGLLVAGLILWNKAKKRETGVVPAEVVDERLKNPPA